MILSRAPTRITLGGGGTDLQSYYSKHGGFVVAGAINKYFTILASHRFYKDIRLSYSKTELIKNVREIEHRIFRVTLEMVGINESIELHSSSDVPADCGLGTSSSFTVALLNGLHTYKRKFITQKQLAEEACDIEINILCEPTGKQDQYMAAFGGLTCLTFEKNGDVVVEPLNVPDEIIDQLERNLVLFFTGKQSSASEILRDQDTKSKKDDPDMIRNLDQIKDIGLQTKKYLENGKVDILGELFHIHWETKKKRSPLITNPFIDECYETARKNGALGGKLIGTGGGGFLMFYCKNGDKHKVVESIQKMGIKWERFHFDLEGAKILVNT